MSITLTSPDINNNIEIDKKYTCYGGNQPYPITLNWDPVIDAKSYIVFLFDETMSFYHWVEYNIPTNINSIVTSNHIGSLMTNSSNTKEFVPPCPKNDMRHKYEFHILALNDKINIIDNENKNELWSIINSILINISNTKIIAKGKLTFFYEREENKKKVNFYYF